MNLTVKNTAWLFRAVCLWLLSSVIVKVNSQDFSTDQPSASKEQPQFLLSKVLQIPEKRALQTTNTCRKFAHFPHSISLDFGRLTRLGDGYKHEHCTNMCLATKEFICVGSLIQLPGTCYLTGYELRNDYFSQHYARVCSTGPDCYLRQPYKSADFTKTINIPRAILGSQAVAELYCMRECEQTDSCVGFDYVTFGNTPKCMFLDLQKVHASQFELYIRRC